MYIPFTKTDLTRCEEFANAIDTNFYASRDQFDNDKRIKDQIIGKLSEIVVYKCLNGLGVASSFPDFNVYDKQKKSWDYDIKSNEFNFHVKGQSLEQGARFGTSWMFQENDRHIFKDFQDNDYVCLVSIDMKRRLGSICAIVAIIELHKLNLFKSAKLVHLKSKRVIYAADLGVCHNFLKNNSLSVKQAPALQQPETK